MAIPGMDLQSQYEQTLQNTIGRSQRDRLQDVRKQQTLANTDWSQRGVGQGAQRMAGFQEVNPSSMPNMSSETRDWLKPLLNTYQEGGQNIEGYYGNDNPYTPGGLESILTKQGYARAPTGLAEQFKSVGLKLPNAYGQDYYNAQHEAIGNDITKQQQQLLQQQKYQNQYQGFNDLLSSLDKTKYKVKDDNTQWGYYSRGFVPGQDNGEWKWNDGILSRGMLMDAQYNNSLEEAAKNHTDVDSAWNAFRSPDQWENNFTDSGYGFSTQPTKDFGDELLEFSARPGAGYWEHPQYDANLRYTKEGGYYTADDLEKLAGNPEKWAPQLTMAVMGAMSGGAASAAAVSAGASSGGVLAGIAGGAGAAIPSAMNTGLNTGDWGKAATSVGLGALGGGLTPYTTSLSKSLGASSQLANTLGRGLSSGIVNTAGQALSGNPIDWKSSLGNVIANMGSSYLGNLASGAVDGRGGDILGGAVGGFSGNALKNILQGKSLDIGTALDTFSGATGGLGKMFSNSKEDQQTALRQPTKTQPTNLSNIFRG